MGFGSVCTLRNGECIVTLRWTGGGGRKRFRSDGLMPFVKSRVAATLLFGGGTMVVVVNVKIAGMKVPGAVEILVVGVSVGKLDAPTAV